MKKITFENKLASLKVKSQYIISSADINEIKNVINSISDKIQEKINLDKKKYNYIFISLPTQINRNYDIEIEASSNNFHDVLLLKLSENENNFYIFSNGVFTHLNNNYISNQDSGKILVINIENIISNVKNDVLRFRFFDKSYETYTNYVSVDKNVNTKLNENELKYINYNFYTIADLKFKNHIAALLDYGFDLSLILNSINYQFDEKTQIQLYSYIYDGLNIIDVTNLTTYTCDNNNIILNSSIISSFNAHKFLRFNINSSIEYNGKTFFENTNICINPIVLIDIDGTFSSINFVNDSYTVSFFAKYSNQTSLNILNDDNFNLIIKNGNFSFNRETGILTPLNKNTVDEITISYIDHDFPNEQIEKTYILKIEGIKIINIVGIIEKPYLTTVENITKYSVLVYYNDDSQEDITFNENLEIKIFNNKEKDHNTLSVNKEAAEISTNNLLYNDEKTIMFSYIKDDQIFYSFKQLKLINSSYFSISGEIVTSDGNECVLDYFETELVGFEEMKKNSTDEDMSNVKILPYLAVLLYKNGNIETPIQDRAQYLKFNHFENIQNSTITINPFNLVKIKDYFYVKLYLSYLSNTDNSITGELFLNDIFKYNIDKTTELYFKSDKIAYTLVYYPLSKMKKAKFIKNHIIELNKSFNENYVVGFKNIDFTLIKKAGGLRTSLELIELYGIFETSNGYEYTRQFICDELHNVWIPTEVPVKATKLKSIRISVAYFE